MLAALGVSDREESVYHYLVSTAPATMEEVSDGTGLPVECAADALYGLLRHGFAHRLKETPARFTAASPSAVGAVISRKLADLQQAQDMLAALTARYSAQHLTADGIGAFEVIRGLEPLRERTLDMVTTARFEALNMVKPPVVAVQATEGVEPDPRVRGRVVFDRDVVTDLKNLDAIRSRPGTHYEVRVHTMVPVKMLAVDRSMALVPIAQDDDVPVGLLVFKGALLDSFLALFDYVWETSVGFHVRDRGEGRDAGESADPGDALAAVPRQRRAPLSAPDRQLLSLLLAGLTDKAIAAHFRISVRTVERKVRALMDAAHVRTRMQLAWEASRQGWL